MQSGGNPGTLPLGNILVTIMDKPHQGPQPIYLDNAATTRPLPEVILTMGQVLYDTFANPSSTHTAGATPRLWSRLPAGRLRHCSVREAPRCFYLRGDGKRQYGPAGGGSQGYPAHRVLPGGTSCDNAYPGGHRTGERGGYPPILSGWNTWGWRRTAVCVWTNSNASSPAGRIRLRWSA